MEQGKKHIFEIWKSRYEELKHDVESHRDSVGDCLSSSSQTPFSERDLSSYLKSTSSTPDDWLKGEHLTELDQSQF